MLSCTLESHLDVLCNRSLGLIMGYSWLCLTKCYTVRLVQDLLLAQSVIISYGYVGTLLVAHRVILLTRLSVFETTTSGDLWEV